MVMGGEEGVAVVGSEGGFGGVVICEVGVIYGGVVSVIGGGVKVIIEGKVSVSMLKGVR